MSAGEMRQQLIEKIKTIEDDNILEEVYRILEVGTTEIEQIVLSEAQKKLIDEGLAGIEKGNYLSNEDANNEIEKWLKK